MKCTRDATDAKRASQGRARQYNPTQRRMSNTAPPRCRRSVVKPNSEREDPAVFPVGDDETVCNGRNQTISRVKNSNGILVKQHLCCRTFSRENEFKNAIRCTKFATIPPARSAVSRADHIFRTSFTPNAHSERRRRVPVARPRTS